MTNGEKNNKQEQVCYIKCMMIEKGRFANTLPKKTKTKDKNRLTKSKLKDVSDNTKQNKKEEDNNNMKEANKNKENCWKKQLQKKREEG